MSKDPSESIVHFPFPCQVALCRHNVELILSPCCPDRLALPCSAPTLAEVGEEGTELWAALELKLVADVGIIGVPSAGKSHAAVGAVQREAQDRGLPLHHPGA